jgi:formylglycine-generating enzyme
MKINKNEIPENPLKLFKFIQIKPGKFLMGSPKDEEGRCDDENQVDVEITHPFEMQETQVTQLQYFSIMNINPSSYEGMQKPVQNICWDDIQEFIKKLNDLDSEYIYRLPTEVEWEYCCRAGTTTPYSFDNNDIKDYAHFNSADGPIDVKSKNPNPWGLFGMHGNVWELCNDRYLNKLTGGKDPQNLEIGSYRVLRGGSWRNDAQVLRSAYRSAVFPGYRIDYVGFRLVRTPISKDFAAKESAAIEMSKDILKEWEADAEELYSIHTNEGGTINPEIFERQLALIELIRKKDESLNGMLESFEMASKHFPARITESLDGYFLGEPEKAKKALALTEELK